MICVSVPGILGAGGLPHAAARATQPRAQGLQSRGAFLHWHAAPTPILTHPSVPDPNPNPKPPHPALPQRLQEAVPHFLRLLPRVVPEDLHQTAALLAPLLRAADCQPQALQPQLERHLRSSSLPLLQASAGVWCGVVWVGHSWGLGRYCALCTAVLCCSVRCGLGCTSCRGGGSCCAFSAFACSSESSVGVLPCYLARPQRTCTGHGGR